MYNNYMNLTTIKQKSYDKYTKQVFKQIDLIRKECRIDKNAVFYLISDKGHHQFFYCDGFVYVANVAMEYDSANNESKIETMYLKELYKVKLLSEKPKTLKDITFEVKIMNDPRYTFTPEEFLSWADYPCDLTIEIDSPYYQVISYLKNYTKETFSNGRFIFYSKPDEDYTSTTNIYAFDTKNKTEVKLYIPNKCIKVNDKWKYVAPDTLKDIIVDDLSGKLSDYQKRGFKKAFLEVANEENKYFKVKNYWVMELLKLAVQPILFLHEWSSHRVFCTPKRFSNIWVYDFPEKEEEPSFYILDNDFRVAVLKFKAPEYLFKGIYKRGLVKTKCFELDKEYIKELIEFLKSPADTDEIYKGKKYVKTRWQQLIFEYNHNTAGWGWGETGFDISPEKDTNRTSQVEALPFDLPIPDYTKLLNTK